ncbi:tetratricopeptide repeat protein [Luteolibacter marinus]|uniref:tetratricopeptide repeat protein n=1 Tax=Luteolibacter marinus TaxID=2776705 RepID=UPI001865D888|nr:tetratricopeptide repeat protein [Luteolibacter marinus]
MKAPAIFLILSSLAGAHPDPRHTLQHLDEHLAESPDDPELLRQKADLLLETGHPADAAPVVAQVLRLDPANPDHRLLDARLSGATEGPAAAVAKLLALVSENSGHAAAWDLLARMQDAAGHRDEAIDAKRQFLWLAKRPAPGDVMTLAAWLRDRGDAAGAIDVLDQGLAKLGCLTGLQEMAIELETGLGRFDSSLRRIDALAARFRPSVELSRKRAVILMAAGRPTEAAGAYDAAVAMLDALPARRREEPRVQRLREELVAKKAACLAAP